MKAFSLLDSVSPTRNIISQNDVIESVHTSNVDSTKKNGEKNNNLVTKKEIYYNKSKRVLCFAAFLATLGCLTTIINALLSFLNEMLNNDKLIKTLHSIVNEEKMQ